MGKLKMRSPDLVPENIAKIRELFPDCVTEARDESTGELCLKVDFDQLRQTLSGHVVEGERERYRLDWPGKRDALLAGNAPTTKTLRPVPGKSGQFDETDNLIIAGDNLDALKLLQKAYLGRVKMIYIDPPYNRGNDFIYRDDFSETSEDYLEKSMQVDAEQGRLVANKETQGRFHSDWLSMMYSRLRLARSLLREDGVIYISIDDGEVHNLREMADEVFGGDNFVSNIVWEKKFSPSNDARWLSDNHDHILLYARDKNAWRPKGLPRSEEQDKRYSNRDDDPRGPWTSGDLSVKTYSEAYDYPITTPSGQKINPPHGRCWRVSKDRLEELIADNRIWFGASVPRLKRFLSEVKEGIVPLTIWKHKDVGHNQAGRQELKKLFDGKGYFDGPKPVSLLRRAIHLADVGENEIVMDFFAGSGTTAHAVMEANAEDGVNRKFILVQLPEPIDKESEAGKAGFATIADITADRVRRAGEKLLEGECHSDWKRGVGFRYLKVDTSNMMDVFYRPDEVRQQSLLGEVDNIKQDRTAEDLLFQVLIDWGVDPTLPIRRETIKDKTVYFVDDNALVACFDMGITEEFAKALITPPPPIRVVFRDNGFASDAVKINVEQIFRQLSPTTEVKSI